MIAADERLTKTPVVSIRTAPPQVRPRLFYFDLL